MSIAVKSQKHLFQIPENEHYLNCASMAPLLKSVEEAGLKGINKRRYPGHFVASNYFDEVNLLKKHFASLIHAAHPEEIAIIPSASYGMANAIQNVCPKKGGHALILQGEFPSGRLALERWCEDHAQELKEIGPGSADSLDGKALNQRVLEAIKPESSILVMSCVHWMNGIRFDMKAISARCQETKTLLIVDGTQGVGVSPMDVQEYKIDALICAGYKWLMGPYSVAMAYYGPHFHHGRPIEESWRNRTNAQAFSDLTDYGRIYIPMAGRYEVGEASNFISIPMQSEGIRQVMEWSPAAISSYCRNLMQPLYAVLKKNGQEVDPTHQSAHIQGIYPPEGMSPAKFSEKLAEKNIRTSVRGAYIRVSTHLFNEEQDIQALIDCMS
jgi:selenocysteine lyase/cysteine desulfurase